MPLCVFPTEMYYIDKISSNLVIEGPSRLCLNGIWIYNLMLITIAVVSLNLDQDEVYNIM